MPKQIIAAVFSKDDMASYGPDYALIIPDGDIALLMDKVAATDELAKRFLGDATTSRTGPLYSTEWWLHGLPLRVTWLRHAALLDDDEEEPGWMSALNDENTAVVEGFEPRLGEDDEDGLPENEFTAVDLETVRLFPDGTLKIEANVDGTSLEFCTIEIAVQAILGVDVSVLADLLPPADQDDGE